MILVQRKLSFYDPEILVWLHPAGQHYEMPGARPGSTSEARFRSLLDDVHTQGRELNIMSAMPPCVLLSNNSFASLRSPWLPGPWLCVRTADFIKGLNVLGQHLVCSPTPWTVTLDE